MAIEGSVVVVTGGAVRLGRALALALARQGARLAIHYNASAGPAHTVVSQITQAGGEAFAVQADLSQPRQAPAVIQRSADHFGQVDVLINSAAIFESGNWHDTTEENWDKHFAVNLKSPFFLSQAFARNVGSERSAHIVNIADWRGARPGADHIAYTLTKAALIAMTKSLAQALAPNIQVNAVAPGLILPPLGRDREYLNELAKTVPAQRAGLPEDIAKTVIYLLETDFVTGELIFVTGGQHL